MIDKDLLIRQLKKEHGDIFGIELNGTEFIYRPLTIREMNEGNRFDNDMDIEDFYVKTALLWPENFNTDRMRAGDHRTLTEAIMSVSGILDVDTVKGYLNGARENITKDVVGMMKSYIIAAMPTYRDDELDVFTMKELIEKVVLSEQVLTLQQAVMGIQSDGVRVQIYTEEELQAMQEVAQPKKRISRTREALLKQIREEELDSVTGRYVDNRRNLKELPDDILEKMTGKDIDPNDPIAAKLFGS